MHPNEDWLRKRLRQHFSTGSTDQILINPLGLGPELKKIAYNLIDKAIIGALAFVVLAYFQDQQYANRKAIDARQPLLAVDKTIVEDSITEIIATSRSIVDLIVRMDISNVASPDDKNELRTLSAKLLAAASLVTALSDSYDPTQIEGLVALLKATEAWANDDSLQEGMEQAVKISMNVASVINHVRISTLNGD